MTDKSRYRVEPLCKAVHKTVFLFDDEEGLDSSLIESNFSKSPTLRLDTCNRWGVTQDELRELLPYIVYFAEHGKLPNGELPEKG